MPLLRYAIGNVIRTVGFDSDGKLAHTARELLEAKAGLVLTREQLGEQAGTTEGDGTGHVLAWVPRTAVVEFIFDGTVPEDLHSLIARFGTERSEPP
jgi:hypothetical protein